MSEDDFEKFLREQLPFRPQHPDFERMAEVTAQMEAWKAAGIPPEEAFAKIVDVYSLSYMGVQRAGLNTPDSFASRRAMVIHVADAWTEGFGYGVLFERAGGHREEAT